MTIMTQSKASSTRFAYLDALRGWAILLVLFGHTAGMAKIQGWLRTIADSCMMGVVLFFVISAFTIFHMYFVHAGEESRPVRNFLIRRLFRIAPLYWFAIFFYHCIWGPLPASQTWHYFLNIFFLHALNPETQTSVVPGGWSLSIEAIFYLFLPILVVFLKDLRRSVIFTALCVSLFPVLIMFLRPWVDPAFVHAPAYLVEVFWDRVPPNTLGTFSFGIMLYFLLRKTEFTGFARNKSTNIALTVLALAVLCALPFMAFRYPLKQHVYGLFFMIFALMLSQQPWKVFVNPVTVFLGKISYSFYIFHFAVLTWLYTWLPGHFSKLPSQGYRYFLLYLVLALIGTVPLAWGGFHLIEQPAIRLSRWLIYRLENRDNV